MTAAYGITVHRRLSRKTKNLYESGGCGKIDKSKENAVGRYGIKDLSAVLNCIKPGILHMNNIVLIGMPGVGKSTVGVILAKELGYQFIDADLLIQKREKRLLKEIIAQEGVDGFIEVENQVNASIEAEHTVIATGGSVVYGKEAMAHLKKIATVVYLRLSYEALRSRLGNLRNRGVVLREGQTLKDLYDERVVLYERYADITIDEENKGIEETLQSIVNKL